MGEAIDVQTRGDRPRCLTLHGRRCKVLDTIDYWVIQGQWWGRPERRVYFRVVTEGGVLDMYRSDGAWRLDRVLS